MMERMASLRRVREAIAAAVAAVVLCASGQASAQETAKSRSAAAARLSDRPYTQAELGAGMLTLPATEFCLRDPATCTRGEIVPAGFLVMLYRPNRRWAIGAGASMAVSSNTPNPTNYYTQLDRSHSRNYLLFDTMARYYALQLDWIEGWVGASIGAVIVRDMYKNNADNPSAPIVGPKGVDVRSEALTTGIEAGLAWSFGKNWSIAAALRSAWWLLPDERSCAPTGDCATLSGKTAMFSLSAVLGYRIGL